MAEDQHHPVQILTYIKEKKSFELNSKELETILENSDVRDANIAVVSIAGAYRKGKSFMLSFFLRYLTETYIHEREDWLGDEVTQLSGFSWRGGNERNTSGLWIWSKVFTKILPNGEKIGILLMDTQGTFDNNTTMRDNVTIFSLSTMLASIQIYNVFTNIQEDDLQHLQLFTAYGKLALEQTHEKAFQMLLFLIRDWSSPYEAAYGFTGGRQVLERKLQMTEDQEDEIVNMRKYIKSCFEKLDCFLMPSPGKVAVTSEKFSGQLKDVDPEFKAMLLEFIPALLAPENICLKKIGGHKLNGRSLLTYIQTYWNVFSKGDLPTPQTILGATSEANNLAATKEATEFYHQEMASATGIDKDILQFGQMVELNDKIVKQTLKLFRSKAVMGDERMKTEYYEKLKSSLQNYFMPYLGQNDAKQAKDLKITIDNLSAQINDYRSNYNQQAEVMKRHKVEFEEYRQSTEAEKKLSRTQHAELLESLNAEKEKQMRSNKSFKAEIDELITRQASAIKSLNEQNEKNAAKKDAEKQRLNTLIELLEVQNKDLKREKLIKHASDILVNVVGHVLNDQFSTMGSEESVPVVAAPTVSEPEESGGSCSIM